MVVIIVLHQALETVWQTHCSYVNWRINNLFVGPFRMAFGRDRGGKSHNFIMHSHMDQSEKLIVCLSLANCACVIWCYMLFCICHSIKRLLRRSVINYCDILRHSNCHENVIFLIHTHYRVMCPCTLCQSSSACIISYILWHSFSYHSYHSWKSFLWRKKPHSTTVLGCWQKTCFQIIKTSIR